MSSASSAPPEVMRSQHPVSSRNRGGTVGVVTLLTLLVSALGYLREASLAARFGVSATMDAYFGAIFVPSNLYLILVVGTLSPIFIPILLQADASEDPHKVSETFSVVTNFVALIMLASVTLGMLTVRSWLPLVFPGFDATTTALAIRLVYIIFPAIVFLALAGIFTAVLNGYHKFAVTAFAPALSSIAVIVAALLSGGERAIYVVGIATTIGFVLQCLLLLYPTAATGVRYQLIFNLRHPAIAELLRVGGPLLLYLVIGNASLLVERNIASRLSAGAVSAITYAIRLFAVPSNLLAAPLAIVSYPHFAREALQREHGDLRNQISQTFRMVVFLFLPITIWVVLNALPITRLLYERGQFRPEDSLVVARVLGFYSIGILPLAAGTLLLRCFYAIRDTVTPLLAEAINLVFYVVAATFLSNRFGISGLAVSRGLTFFLVTAIFVFFLWRRKGLLHPGSDFLSFFTKTTVASLAMVAVNWGSWRLLQTVFDSAGPWLRLTVTCLILLVGALTFVAVSRLLKLGESSLILKVGLQITPVRRVWLWLKA